MHDVAEGEDSIKKDTWHDMSPAEEDLICRLHDLLGDSICPFSIFCKIHRTNNCVAVRRRVVDVYVHEVAPEHSWLSLRWPIGGSMVWWGLISGRLPNRNAEEVEKYWRMRKQMLQRKVIKPVCVRAKPGLKLFIPECLNESQGSIN
ncbi:hypothetical protein ACLOJK_016929 [Asimina triloba]